MTTTKFDAKLAYFHLTTNNVRLNNKGKVKGVNKNKGNGKYDARLVAQLPNTGSGGRNPFHMYFASYKNADDATVAVTLLWKLLETTVTIDNEMTYCVYLKTLTNENRQIEVKNVLKYTRQQMKQMIEAMQILDLPVAEASWESYEDSSLPVAEIYVAEAS